MTISRRSFISGLAAFLSLLVWPWRKEPDVSLAYHLTGIDAFAREIEETLTYGPDSDIVKMLNEPNARPRTATEVQAKMRWRDLSAPPSQEEWERRIEDEFFSIDLDYQPTHFQGISKRYS